MVVCAVLLFSGCQQERIMVEEVVPALQIAVLVDEGFHDGEAFMPIGFLTNLGAEVTVIGPEKGIVTAYNSEFTIRIEKSISEVSVDDFDALIIPGGHAPARLRENDAVVGFARDFFNSGKTTAAICHGPQVLITAGVMNGRTSTGVSAIQEELEAAGANYMDEAVVIDDNLITSRIPPDLSDFSRAISIALVMD